MLPRSNRFAKKQEVARKRIQLGVYAHIGQQSGKVYLYTHLIPASLQLSAIRCTLSRLRPLSLCLEVAEKLSEGLLVGVVVFPLSEVSNLPSPLNMCCPSRWAL